LNELFNGLSFIGKISTLKLHDDIIFEQLIDLLLNNATVDEINTLKIIMNIFK